MSEMFDLPLHRNKLYEQVADRIQGLIVAESLCPGHKLPSERELAERLKVSRTVVREAIRALSVRGLVRVKPGCGTYVQELTPKDAAAPLELFLKLRRASDSFDDLHEVRRMIEVEVAGLAAERATEEDHQAMEAAIEGMVACRKATHDDLDRYVQCDLAFHAALAAATGNDLFTVLLSPISGVLLEAIRLSSQVPGAVNDGIAHHRNILKWVRRGDVEKARQAMRDHIRHAHSLVERAREQAESSSEKGEEGEEGEKGVG
jgi:GntR family transcriptional repressor for pyruvate dehydrogenase complex